MAVAVRERQAEAVGSAREALPRESYATPTRHGTGPSPRDAVAGQTVAEEPALRTDDGEPAVSVWLLVVYLMVVFLALDLGMAYAVLRTLVSGSVG